MPLDKRAIAHLAGNSLGLDLYTLFAYRLPRLKDGLHLSWPQLRDQLGSGEAHTRSLAQRIRDVLPEIKAVYPDAKFEATRHGLLLRPSPPAVPRTGRRTALTRCAGSRRKADVRPFESLDPHRPDCA